MVLPVGYSANEALANLYFAAKRKGMDCYSKRAAANKLFRKWRAIREERLEQDLLLILP